MVGSCFHWKFLLLYVRSDGVLEGFHTKIFSKKYPRKASHKHEKKKRKFPTERFAKNPKGPKEQRVKKGETRWIH